MGRWNPGARGRLEQAAYELFRDRGYEQTTVAEIAARAGLTERSFFRHFADKREVFFGGTALLRDELVRVLAETPPEQSAIDAVRTAVETMSLLLHGRREAARERQRMVAAHADLRERELIKRAMLTEVLAQALRQRGVAEPAASLAADMGMSVFFLGFARWLDDPGEREFVDLVREGFAQLQAVAAGS